jgi:hypothetical protein
MVKQKMLAGYFFGKVIAFFWVNKNSHQEC